MKFADYKYERVDFDEAAKELSIIAEAIKNSRDINEIKALISELNQFNKKIGSISTLASIRHSINTLDKFYEDEINYIQENANKLDSVSNELNKILVSHPLKSELEAIYGSYWFKKIELALKSFDDSIIELLIKESKLTTEYDKIMASCELEFNGEICNLSKLRKYLTDKNRDLRKAAALKINEFLAANEDKIDDIYDQLVHARNDMAIKLGYKNFVELGYIRMGRTDYNPEMVANYRKQVVECLVPVANEIFMSNAKNIGIDHPMFYDLGLEFLDGNPTPKGTKDELVAKALKMYTEMSKETGEFFKMMVDRELLDLETKKGKQNGGYCTYIPSYDSPFIFSNFNGTSGDVDVLTHEAGHAFMAYTASKLIEDPEMIWPTSDACEIHSMSMEFFAYPWLELFFKEDTLKYKISHTNGTLTFIPYGICVDHFQHLVYENPDATPAQRKQMWKDLEKLYTPWRDMSDLPMYDKGTFWFNQLHIFQVPFYYIDYTLAQVCALEFYCDSVENKEKTWERYVKLCGLGGTDSFVGLTKAVGLHNPFEDGSIKSIVDRLKPIMKSYK